MTLLVAICCNILTIILLRMPHIVFVQIAKSLSMLVGSAFYQDFKGYFFALAKLVVSLSVFLTVISCFVVPWLGFVGYELPPYYLVIFAVIVPLVLRRALPAYAISHASSHWAFWHKLTLYFFLWDPRVNLGLAKNFGKDVKGQDANPIFLLSVARQGTTAISDFVCENYQIAHVQFNDAPYYLVPEFAKFKKDDVVSMKRFHLDALMTHSFSLDAFDEAFATHMNTHHRSDYVAWYDNFIQRLCFSRKRQFAFVKNNNNWQRYDMLRTMPSAQFILLLREPLETAISLARNHIEFCKLGRDDTFFADYMTMIGHKEFGPNYVNINAFDRLDKSDLLPYIQVFLEDWIAYARFVEKTLDECDERVHLVFSDNWVKPVCSLFEKMGVHKQDGNQIDAYASSKPKIGDSDLTATIRDQLQNSEALLVSDSLFATISAKYKAQKT